MDDQLIQTRLSLLTPEYREFVMGDFTTEVARVFGEAHGFSEDQTDILENAITLYLLLFMDGAGVIQFIHRNCGLPVQTTLELFSAIKSSLPNDIREAVEATFIAINGTAPSPLANEIAEAELQSDIVETEEVFEQLQGIRTMARDMRAIQHPNEPVHRSTQDSLLQRPNNSPRWDTEQ
ncbi:MAG TPA: hypothetical protein VGE31_01285 [Candidatus Paceibacterota bacterium]